MIVDDEAVVTQSLAAFLELEGDYTVIQHQSPREALTELNRRHVDLIISDFLMPDLNGLEFLKEAKRYSPEAPRIMLTGYADKENSIRAINEVGLFQYLEKPWDNDQFKLVIDSALRNKGLQESLAERIRDLDAVLRDRNRLAEKNEVIQEELATARRLQRSLLPQQLPSSHGITLTARYCPAFEVGGDFYDVMPLAGGRCGILVADATGHGIQAALSTALLKFAFNNFANTETPPHSILRGMNDILIRGLPEETFITAAVGVLDLREATLSVVNAGNPHPFLLRRAAGDVERIVANGLALGMFDSELFQPDPEQIVELHEGDSVLFHTDGLGEIIGEGGEQFHDTRLQKLLAELHGQSHSDLFETLLAEGRRFGDPRHEWDDVTLLGIEKQ
jgi:serine phosphatase RsbU (regulator of sigma subunit)